MKVIETIDITPTRSEAARVTAYCLASHLQIDGIEIFGDYWNYTEAQENAIFATWNKLQALNVEGSFQWTTLPINTKGNLIKSLYTALLYTLTD